MLFNLLSMLTILRNYLSIDVFGGNPGFKSLFLNISKHLLEVPLTKFIEEN